MDGNKKITGIVFAGIVTLAMSACKVQPSGYISLYVDNLVSVNDTTLPVIAPLYMEDTVMAHEADTASVIEAESPVVLRSAEEIFKTSSDSAFQHEFKILLKAITDSVKLLRHQMIDLQKQLTAMPGNSNTGVKSQEFQQPDSLQTEDDLKHLIQVKNDTIATLHNQVTELKKFAGLKADETTALLRSKNDTIIALRRRMNDLQNYDIVRADTTYVIRETAKLPLAENRQSEQLTLQLIKAKDEQIQLLQNQLNALQTTAARVPQQARITIEPTQTQPVGRQQTDHVTIQLLQAKNDTILFLRSQLDNLRLPTQKRDTIYIEKETKELQPKKELVVKQKTTDLQELKDTIRSLKTRVLSLEEQILPVMDTITPTMHDEKDVPYTAITDTTLLVAYYELGEIKPLEEESLLKQIKEQCSNKNVTKITLSGYTDSSGNEAINKKITNMRINYLSEKISPWIAKDKVYFQNFGDTFASDMVVKNERRIEIRMHTK